MAALNERGVLVVLWRWRRLPSAATRVWNARASDLLRRGQGPPSQAQARNKPQPLEALSSAPLLFLYSSSSPGRIFRCYPTPRHGGSTESLPCFDGTG